MRISDWSSDVCSSDLVVVALIIAGCDGAEMFEFIEESFDEITVSVEERAESRDVLTVRHWLDAGTCAACGQSGAHGVAVIGTVSKQDAAFKSEAHTSELQATMRNPYADFCLIKKKQTT